MTARVGGRASFHPPLGSIRNATRSSRAIFALRFLMAGSVSTIRIAAHLAGFLTLSYTRLTAVPTVRPNALGWRLAIH
jgi:hypothetical protein